MADSADRDRELREALRLAGFGVWRWDTTTNAMEWDARMHALYDLPSGTFGGKPMDAINLMHPEDREGILQQMKQPTELRPAFMEVRVLRADGSVRWLSASSSFVGAAAAGGVFAGVVWDTTERHAMVQSLRANESLLRQAQRLAKLATWTWTADEGTCWSSGMFELYGLQRGPVPTVAEHMALLHPDDRPRVQREYIDALRSNESLARHEFRIIHPDGSVHHLSSMFQMERDEVGKVHSVLGVVQDITLQVMAAQERVELEAQLQQAQRLDALGKLAGGIAHDFNNILLAIGGNAQLALEDCSPDSPLRLNLQEIEKARARASGLVRRILTFARPSAREQQPTAIESVVNEALNLLRAVLPAMIELRPNVQASLPKIMADAGQIHQVVMNLVTNAAQAIGERGGVVHVSVDQVEAESASYIRLTVRDSGPGMDAMTRARMFEPFFTTKGTGGTGLGLAVVHGIVQGHRGTVDVTTEPGVGTSIEVLLPISHASQNADADVARVARPGQRQHVVYVDDEESIVSLVARALKRWNYRVTTFTDPLLALAAIREHPSDFDAVITDLAMPRMTGFELASLIVQLRPELPIVLVSGHLLDEERARAYEAGVRAIALKPNAIEELPHLLDDIFNKEGNGMQQDASRGG
ncbi:PAS domain S-box-containing protein [Povalibacter uvarum]|uniref:histidine kinase n=1 Tax=Povalibacter uvarum TaxID=732238 RepID=A0A841HGV7_9GAMM|nr:PAS domain-containing protein [Povalibacter uvarum]MBB6091315.1 PAS domain S-box-containing protein [Povalibacter uvarum]